MESVTPNLDLCRGLQAPLLLIKISEDFEKKTIRPEGLGRPQLLSQGRRTRHSSLLALWGTGSSTLSASELSGPPETPRKSLGPTMVFLPEISRGPGEKVAQEVVAEIRANSSQGPQPSSLYHSRTKLPSPFLTQMLGGGCHAAARG